MSSRELEEYIALRATIRERGTTRVWTFLVGLALWSGLVIATAASMALPIATLLPLLVLAGLFEAVYALHVGIERIGRYLQVFHEADEEGRPALRSWEHTAMAFGMSAPPGSSRDPLFSVYFWLAAVANFVPAILAGALPVEWTVIGLAHAVFIARIVGARRYTSRQRALDLEQFRKLRRARLAGISEPGQS